MEWKWVRKREREGEDWGKCPVLDRKGNGMKVRGKEEKEKEGERERESLQVDIEWSYVEKHSNSQRMACKRDCKAVRYNRLYFLLSLSLSLSLSFPARTLFSFLVSKGAHQSYFLLCCNQATTSTFLSLSLSLSLSLTLLFYWCKW